MVRAAQAMGLVILSMAPLTAEAGDFPDRVVRLVAAHSGKCLGVAEGSKAESAPIVQVDCSSAASIWRIRLEGPRGLAQIVAEDSELCLDVDAESTADEARLIQWRCKGSGNNANQLWKLEGKRDRVSLIASHSRKCVDIAQKQKGVGAPAVQYPCHRGANQTFEIREVGNSRDPRVTEPPVAPPTPTPVVEARDCGTGPDDPGCSLAREGRYPVEGSTFTAFLDSARAQRSQIARRESAVAFLSRQLLTARQYGLVLDLFTNEIDRLATARQLAKCVVDPQRAIGFAEKFRSSINQRDYTKLISSLL
jgi:hypothetical protein